MSRICGPHEYIYTSGYRTRLDAELVLERLIGDDVSMSEKPRIVSYYNNEDVKRYAIVLTDTSLERYTIEGRI